MITTRIQVKPVTHKHRKKYFHVIKIPCLYSFFNITISSHDYKMIKSLLDKDHTFFIDKKYIQKLYTPCIRDIVRSNTSLMVNRISISECKKYYKHKNIHGYDIIHFGDLHDGYHNITCLYISFKTKSDMMKWKLKYD